MTCYFIADVHSGNHGGFSGSYQVGLNWRSRRILETLSAAARLVGRSAGLTIAGDLFNSHEPAPQVIAATISALRGETWLADADTRVESPELVTILRGNHDANSTVKGDDALGPLAHVDGLDVVDEPCAYDFADDFGGFMLPFRPGEPEEWVPAALDSINYPDPHRTRVLVTHFGIADETTPEYMRRGSMHVDKLAECCRKHNIRYVFSGDWHSRKVWEKEGVTIVQVGALVPTGFNNPGLDGYGSVWRLSLSGLELVEMPGPRFLRFITLTQLREAVAKWDGERPAIATELFISLTVALDQRDDADTYLNELKDTGVINDFSLEVSVENCTALATIQEQAMTKPQRFEEALRDMVEEAVLPQGVSREDVLARATDVMKRGAAKE